MKRFYGLGFTLAELLIALAILGVIATFTIPKVLQSQEDKKNSAIVKEAAGAMVGALQNVELAGQLNQYTTVDDLTPYINYVSVDTTSTYDGLYSNPGTWVCGVGSFSCIRLANGAVILWSPRTGGNGTGDYFGGINTNHYIYFYVDSDGTLTNAGNPTGSGRSIHISLYYNKRVTTLDNCAAPDVTYINGAPQYFCPAGIPDPPWFTWN